MAVLDPNIWINILIMRARNKEPGAPLALAAQVVKYLSPDCQDPMPDSLRDYLLKGFTAIASGGNANIALLITKLGRPKRDDSLEIAMDIHCSSLPRHTDPGGVYDVIGKKYNISAKTAEQHHIKWREGIEANEQTNREEDEWRQQEAERETPRAGGTSVHGSHI